MDDVEGRELLILAREAVIREKEATGSQYGLVVERGIRSGAWDNGSIVQSQLERIKNER